MQSTICRTAVAGLAMRTYSMRQNRSMRTALPLVMRSSMSIRMSFAPSARGGRDTPLLRRSLVCRAEDDTNDAAPVEDLYDKLDIRVGKVVKAWVHPEADGLFVEEVDVGEEEPRTICSGLVGYVEEAEMQGRDVVVLCNLKPRNMRGIKSNGMLLAASNEDHSTVQLLTPPAGVPAGERVRFGTLEGVQDAADSPNRIQKKKIFEEVQPNLNTSEACVVRYKDLEMITTLGAVTVKDLAGASVS